MKSRPHRGCWWAILLFLVLSACGSGGEASDPPGNQNRRDVTAPSPTAVREDDLEATSEECEPPSVFRDPELIQNPLPDYRTVREECDDFRPPVVQFLVNEKGRTEAHQIVRSTGCEHSDKLILRSLEMWRYNPATCDGEPLKQEVILTVRWGN